MSNPIAEREKNSIQEAIKAFETDNLSMAGINLFKSLGYDTSLQAPLENKNFEEYNENYIQNSLNKDRFNADKAHVSEWKYVDILFQLTDASFSDQTFLPGFESHLDRNEHNSYLCMAIELTNSEYSKSVISNITREVNKLYTLQTIIIFKYGKNITLSLINRRLNKRDSEKDVLEKVTLIKDINFSRPHRAHIEILYDMSLPQLSTKCSISNFESLHKAWSKALDTQELNKRFYTELSDWYFWACKTVVYPGYGVDSERWGLFTNEEKLREHNATNLIRLLTRLLFVWFIKEKQLIPEELFEENKISSLIEGFEPHENYISNEVNPEKKSIYYKAILQNLFFAALNAEHGKRAFRIDGQNQNVTSLMRYKRYHKNPDAFVALIESKVPFMNGGLFECLDYQDEELKNSKGGALVRYEDGFSDSKDNELFVPDYIFFAEDIRVDLSEEYGDSRRDDVHVSGIINILKRYKFTIVENTPVEEDIALDPELLGRVFENLLASYNPETRRNARRQTGSYYTPRTIVEYMVDESIKAYLKVKIHEAIQKKIWVIKETQTEEENNSSLEKKIEDLIRYNDCEPDFSEPEKMQILKFIDNCKILDPACGSGAFPMGILQKMVYVIHKLDPYNYNWKLLQINKISEDKNLSSKEKTSLIVDISSVFDDNELDYGRKLYLIENCIHGIDIQPIATQISRLRFFISLIVDQTVDTKKENFGIRPLPNLENRFVTANSVIVLRDRTGYLTSPEVEKLMGELKDVRHRLFKAKTPSYKHTLQHKDNLIREKLEKELVKLGFDEGNAKLLSSWDPYNRNRSANFFDSEWMFGVRDGFDIVIGNPPYIKEPENRSAFDGFRKTDYYMGKMDLWHGFACIALDLACEQGVVCFIAQNNWTTNAGAGKMRKKIINDSKICQLLDFNDYMVFGSAQIQTMIMLFEKNSKVEEYYFDYRALKIGAQEADLIDLLKKEETDMTKIFTPRIVRSQMKDKLLTFNEEESIFDKIENGKTFFQEDEIAQGIVPNPDIVNPKNIRCLTNRAVRPGEGVFVVENNHFTNLNANESKYVKPLYEPNQMKPYYLDERNRKCLLYITKDNWKNDAPILLSHLEKYKEIMESRRENKCGARDFMHLHWPRDEKFFEACPKILAVRKCVGRPIFVYYEKEAYVMMAVNVIRTTRFNMKTLTGILNSKLVTFWLKSKGKMQGGNFQVDKKPLLGIPLPYPSAISQSSQDKIISLVDKIIEQKKASESFDTSDLEHEVDALVYGIYGLTKEEIEMIEKEI